MGSSTSTVAVDEPALLGMLKEGPQTLGLAIGESVKADAVLDTDAGVRVLFHSSICLNRASRSGNIFLGMVIVFLAALSYNKTVRCQTSGAANPDPRDQLWSNSRKRDLERVYRSVSIVRMLFEDSIYGNSLYDVKQDHAGSASSNKESV